ncbi:Zn-ribbon domain-containing OB-fold protein [Ottowia thiooxydans]|uniref:Zn-ribbon domain-containing OB-fold protein n=1 Tax=Ottowia thiooxydans TaxID=219182 RepID=UPI000421E1BB|nr:OB-fold domain-containing protein [Ottowia thiooxydans]
MEIKKYPDTHFRADATGLTLMAARNPDSGEMRFPPPEFLHGGQAAEPTPMGVAGSLYTFTTVHPGKAPSYSLGMVDFENGLRVFGRLVWPSDATPAIGDVVRAVAFTLADGTADYAFEPVQGVSK